MKPLPPSSHRLCRNCVSLAGNAAGGRVVLLAGGIEDDARLGGVGDDKAQIRIFGAIEQDAPIPLRIEAAGSAGNHAGALHWLSVLAAAEDQRIQPLLRGVEVGGLGMAAAGLHQHHLGVKARGLVHLVDEVLHKGAQEIALAELQHALRRVLQEIALVCRRTRPRPGTDRRLFVPRLPLHRRRWRGGHLPRPPVARLRPRPLRELRPRPAHRRRGLRQVERHRARQDGAVLRVPRRPGTGDMVQPMKETVRGLSLSRQPSYCEKWKEI